MSFREFLDLLSRWFGNGGNSNPRPEPTPQPEPEPITPNPVQPEPAVPTPTEPEPITPTPAQPEPAVPAPTEPEPVTPAPITPPPEPVVPTPVTPVPVEPAPITPTRPSSEDVPQEGVNLDFWKLWQNHPNIAEQEMFPCRREDGVANFANQCAIRMGVCLSKSGLLTIDEYDGVRCWFGHNDVVHSLRARELALWLRNHASTFGAVEIKSETEWKEYVGRTGIIYCQNFWGENNQGDHIDLWDGTGEFMGSGSFTWEGPAMASGGLDYLERAEEVWFWPVY